MTNFINNHQKLIFCLISCLFLTAHSQPKCLHDQSSFLLQFKQEFKFDDDAGDSKTESWRASRDCCSWDGIECDKVGHVIGLDLSYSSLHGQLSPNSSLFSLTHLQQLNLADNDFNYSSIPASLGRLSSLKNLSLSQSMFSGQIPIEISWLNDLVSLDLSITEYPDHELLTLGLAAMTGLVRNATNLRELSLNAIDLSSLEAEAFGNFSSLEILSLSQCKLSGEFPRHVLQLPNMRVVSLASNDQLIGSLPEFLPGSKLQDLDLSGTKFSGTLVDSVGNLKSLNTLQLNNCNFSGSIPTSLGNLSELTDLDLSSNNFSSEIPSTLGSLTRLERLRVSRNQLIGRIPSWLGNLTQLTQLRLSNNQFTGEFPVSLANLTKLDSFDISYNHLSGLVPHDTSKIPNSVSLGNLDLSHNFFNGTIPPSLFTMPSLFILNLDNNEFTGPLTIQNVSSSQLSSLYLRRNFINGELPKSISELTSLTLLNLNANNLSGRVDFSTFSKLSNLVNLQLSYNNLAITYTEPNSTLPQFEYLGLASCNIIEFPKFLETQTKLLELDLTNNRIGGKIPRWFLSTGTETLSRLFLSNNSITGWEEEPSVLPWNSLNYLDLHQNKLSGSLVLPPTSILQYFIYNNLLTGEINPSFCELPYLSILDVSDNEMSGEVPQCFGFSRSLTILSLKQNNFRGHIPQMCSQVSALKTLDLSHNKLHGNLPVSLKNCTQLEVLNIGHNQISDEFPFWTQSLPRLVVLVLRENNFSGSIWHPRKFFGFDKLRIIDLSFNNFSGDLPPDYFRNWTAINSEVPSENKSVLRYMGDTDNYYKDSMTLQNKGASMSYTRILNTLMAIDLSNNRFHGDIPSTIGELKSLLVLNLSSNNFQGLIPPSLGNLNELESLDLSKNRLSGEIPRQLASLTFLSYLVLSENNLSGVIPQGGQMNTFPNSSYVGNAGLCGFPLLNICGTPGGSTTHESGKESDSESGFNWRSLLVGCGFGLVIGFIVEHVIASRRPHWLAGIYRMIKH